MTLLANGHTAPITKSMALDLATYYVALGRAVPSSKWVNVFSDADLEANARQLDSQIDNLFGG